MKHPHFQRSLIENFTVFACNTMCWHHLNIFFCSVCSVRGSHSGHAVAAKDTSRGPGFARPLRGFVRIARRFPVAVLVLVAVGLNPGRMRHLLGCWGTQIPLMTGTCWNLLRKVYLVPRFLKEITPHHTVPKMDHLPLGLASTSSDDRTKFLLISSAAVPRICFLPGAIALDLLHNEEKNEARLTTSGIY